MSNILVTGIAGFIGSHVSDICVKNGHMVVGIDDLSSGSLANLTDRRNVTFIGGSILEKELLIRLVKKHEIDAICHLAAQPSLRRSIDDPAYDAQVNIIGTLNVIEAARTVGAHIVFASTSAVYDPSGVIPFVEDDVIAPNLPYGIAKAAAEMYLRYYGKATILRFGNVYGPRQVPVGENQLVPHVLDHIYKGAPFKINGDGLHSRDLVYVGDIAAACLAALETQVVGTFNCGTNESSTVKRVCDTLAILTSWKGEFEHGPAKVGEMEHSLLDSNQALSSLGWKAEVKLKDGLNKTVEAYK